MTETDCRKSWEARLKWLERQHAPAPDLCPWLRETNIQYGCGSAALAAIDRLSQGAPAVVTGQQAGLLTGPLYTIYKAASAVILARSLSRQLQSPVVPVFWLASEDHDFLEVRSAWFPAGERLEQIAFPGEYSLTPAAALPISSADVQFVTEKLKALLPESDFTADVLSLVSETAAAGAFSDWCGSLLSRLFREQGLVVMDSCGLPLRLAARPVFTWAIESGPDIHRILAEKGAEMKGAGRKPALDIAQEHSHIFLLQEGQRLGLFRDGDKFVDRGNTVSFTQKELLAIVQQEPWRLSPNVVLRPLVQELVVPVLAIIGGPGELAYLEQMKPVFTGMGLEQPPVLPRMGGVILEPPIVRLLDKYDLSPDRVKRGLEAWKLERLEQADSLGISTAFAALRTRIEDEYARITPGLTEIDGQMAELSAKNLAKVLEQVNWLEKRAEASHRQRHGELSRHVQRLETALAPNGKEQQRTHNCLWYINKYGPAFLSAILKQPLAEDLVLYL